MRMLKSNLISTTVLVLFFTMQTFAEVKASDNNGINFRSITFEEAKKISKAENKPLFVHGFADWCHYCMYMKDSVYTDKEVADFYNSHFVCIKIDMEKEGK